MLYESNGTAQYHWGRAVWPLGHEGLGKWHSCHTKKCNMRLKTVAVEFTHGYLWAAVLQSNHNL